MTRAFCITARLRNDVAPFEAGTVCWLHREHDPATGKVKMMFRRRGPSACIVDIARSDLMAIEIRLSATRSSTRWEGNREDALAMALTLAERELSSDSNPFRQATLLADLIPDAPKSADACLLTYNGAHEPGTTR